MLRIGHGYDVHKLVEGRDLILCGVKVPHTLGLLGHSDAGADSLKLLEQVMSLARERGYELLDCDCTIAAQAPKLAPHRERMRKNLAHALGVDVSSVGVKATTTERLGFVGREEGMEAWAVALMEYGR